MVTKPSRRRLEPEDSAGSIGKIRLPQSPHERGNSAALSSILFAELRNPTVFENYQGVIPSTCSATFSSRTFPLHRRPEEPHRRACPGVTSSWSTSRPPSRSWLGIRRPASPTSRRMNLYELGQISASGSALRQHYDHRAGRPEPKAPHSGRRGDRHRSGRWRRGDRQDRAHLRISARCRRSEGGGGCAKSGLRRRRDRCLGNATAASRTALAAASATTFGEAYVGASGGDRRLGASQKSLVAKPHAVEMLGAGDVRIFAFRCRCGPRFGAVLGAGSILAYNYYQHPPLKPGARHPAPAKAPTPATISPQNVPQGVCLCAGPPRVNTTPPTYDPTSRPPLGTGPHLIDQLLHGGHDHTKRAARRRPGQNSPPYPNSFAGLMANSAAGPTAPTLDQPWPARSRQCPASTRNRPRTHRAPTRAEPTRTLGKISSMDQITNPANGQVITISGPSNPPGPRLLHRADQRNSLARQQDLESTTTTISKATRTAGVATLAFTNQSASAYYAPAPARQAARP